MEQIVVSVGGSHSFLTILYIFGLFSLFDPTVSAPTKDFKTSVICTGSTMTVMVDKSSFSKVKEDHLQLSNPTSIACSLQKYSNRTHVIAVIPLNECGTQIEEDSENLIFKNEITTVGELRGVISRKHLMEVRFSCKYPKKGITKLGFIAHRENVTVKRQGIGSLTYQFEFYPDNKFQTRIDPNSYPVEYDLGTRMFMQIKVTSSMSDIELFVESCKAAPFDNLNSKPTYSIIENGCKRDETVLVHSPSHEKHFQFSMEAFKFIGLHDHVYISCAVLTCKKGNSDTRCSQGCIESARSVRHKRDVASQNENLFISQGPLRLRRSAENSRITVTNLNPNLVFVAGSLLSAVGMVCGVASYRTKMAQVKQGSLPVF
ncbi:ZP domain-containing protein-like [Betta splendens]|uniref:ZP domain-containing protein-like n=1 Tax=Betta splendens TaxID=158456 RepID=A0A9W2XP52_BETSP|nr:ZP domain-containing protein-like [Betta splendens]